MAVEIVMAEVPILAAGQAALIAVNIGNGLEMANHEYGGY